MNVRNITSCPTKLDVFRSRGRSLGCSVGNEYHCMLDERKHHVELCISRSWIQPDHCPEYNTAANRIDVTSCDTSEGVCAPTIYWSNTSFQYNGCLGNTGTANTNDPAAEEESSDVLVPVVISIVIVLLLVTISVVLLCYVRRRRRIKKDDAEKEALLEIPSVYVSPEQLEKGREIIKEHRNDGTYVPTNAAMDGQKILNAKKILIIKGITGSGKTKTALQVVSEWMKEENCRQCIYLCSFDDRHMLNVNDNTCIVLDGFFTRWVLDSSSPFLSEFCLRLHAQVKAHKNVYLIITVNYIIHSSHRQMLQKYSLFSKDHEVILNYPDLEEKKKILNPHLDKLSDEKTNPLSGATEQDIKGCPRPNLTEKKSNDLSSAYTCRASVGFPSVCWMYTNIPRCAKEGDRFFRACQFRLQDIIANMKNPLKCCLHYAMFQRNCFVVDTSTDTLDQKCLKELRDIFEYKEMTENSIQDCFEKERAYFSVGKNPDTYTFSQNILYEQCLKEWIGDRKRRYRFLSLCSLEQVKEVIRDETYNVASGDSILRLKRAEYKMFVPNFVSFLKKHKELEHHPLLQNKEFRKLKEEELAKQEERMQEEKEQDTTQKKEDHAKREKEKEERAKQETEKCTKQEKECAKQDKEELAKQKVRVKQIKGERAMQEEVERVKQEKEERAKQEKGDLTKQESEKRAKQEKEDRAKQEKEKDAKQDKEERVKQEKEDSARQEKGDRAKQDKETLAKQEKEERAKKEKEERAKQNKKEHAKQEKAQRAKQDKNHA